VKSRLETLVAYGADISVAGPQVSILLWTATSGYQEEGVEWLINRAKQYYERRRQERRVKAGERVAVIGSGMAIVIAADDRQVKAVLGNGDLLSVNRNRVEWNERNLRWEIPSAVTPVDEQQRAAEVCCEPLPPWRRCSLRAGKHGGW
jgi:hypothetical protein